LTAQRNFDTPISIMSLTSFCRTTVLLATLLPFPAFAQDRPAAEPAPGSEAGADQDPGAEARAAAMKKIESFGWTRSGVAKIGTRAEIAVPEGLQMTNGSGAQKLLRMFNNIPSGRELGILSTPNLSWWADFTFSDDGYVKDDEKSDIDADKLLTTLKEGQRESNKARREQKLTPFVLTDWAVKPFYNETSKALEFGFKIKEEGAGDDQESVNYSTKILGRHGVMNVTLVCAPDNLEESLTQLRGALKGFSYVGGETYAEYRKGDKIAEYGLTALVAGGTLAVAAKTGLLGKLLKPILIGLVAVGALFKRFWGKISGRGQS
jgi:uncharacterized membrane-anchored protein